MTRHPFSILALLFLTLMCSCAHAPYDKTNVLYIARSADIREADKKLELGKFCFKIFDYPNATKYFLKGLDISEKAGYQEGAFSGYNNLGVLYTEIKKYDIAWSNLCLARSIAEKGKFRQQTAEVLNNLGYLIMESKLSNTGTSAKTFLELALKQGPDLPLRLVIENNQGLLELSKGEYVKALTIFNRVQHVSESKNLYETLVMATCHIGDFFEIKGVPNQALPWFKKALDMANFWEFPNGKIQALSKLGHLAESQKDWANALLYYQAISSIHKDIKASTYYQEDAQRISDLQQKQTGP